MRTTLSIDDDVLEAVRALAADQHKSIGSVISELARRSLQSSTLTESVRNGIPLLPLRGVQVTSELVQQLGDELP